MKLKVTSAIRRDGKYKVTLFFPGSANMFGGHYPGRTFRKLMTAQQILDQLPAADEDAIIPREIRAQLLPVKTV